MVVLLALLATLLGALAAAAEQRVASRLLRSPIAARCAPGRAELSWVGLTRCRARQALLLAVGLVLTPLWIAGWTADAFSFVSQAAALHVGSLSVVQPLLVTTLLFSLALAAWASRRRPRWTDWAGGAATFAGLALVLSGRRMDASAAVHEGRLYLAALLVVLVVGGLVLAALARPARGRAASPAVTLAVAAAAMFSLGAAFTKLVAGQVAAAGVGAAAGYWPAYALALVSVAGLALQQGAFSVGSLPATMTAITVTDPLVSYVLGIVGFSEPAPRGAAAAGLVALGLSLVCAGVYVLARSPLLRTPPPAPAGAPAPALPPAHVGVASTAAARSLPDVSVRQGRARVSTGSPCGAGGLDPLPCRPPHRSPRPRQH